MFQGRSFTKEIDFTQNELNYLIDFAIHLKQLKKQRIPHEYLKGQSICLIFEKTSTRTRAAFSVAASDLGATADYFGASDMQMGKKESIEDTAKILGSMYDGIQFRGYKQSDVEALATHAGVPVWNGLTDEWHPTQMIADFMTLKENFNRLSGLNLVYCGDGRNNVANSLMITSAILGVNYTVASPKELFPDSDLVELAQSYAKKSGATITLTEDIKQAVTNADAIYTDVWVSMGEEALFDQRIKQLMPYQVTQELFDLANEDAIFLHCLPAYHDTLTNIGQEIASKYNITEMEVTDEVFRSDYAKQFDQGENRLHSIKAIMAATNGNLFIKQLD
ncbi:ornithine carbamoyltransferase [Ruoffia sp. FAM 24228]|uniref:Ornithine carbamoyltransferase n=1 Tax=Ruoffia tabacinasalis TaxID=87458 RepID=A0A5R9DYE6_9LACT|nr:ornithine carbamoyltransferase [Ruoffia tabacinasalis]TLQ41786.1 ornithine carbamoyltransferase [Ruoffia tabacinasalis]HBY90723.1 ornithine carbamoyltransferase [Aerococcaceae bacterium]